MGFTRGRTRHAATEPARQQGLIGTFALYHQPLAATTAAVLVYDAIALWVPALPGSVAFVQLRRALQRGALTAAMCMPLADTAETAGDVQLAR